MLGRLINVVTAVVLQAACLVWVAGFWPAGHRVIGVFAGAALFLAVAVLETLIHELGHLLVAVALRVRVLGMRLLGKTVFGRTADKPANMVMVDLLSMRRLASLRTVAFTVGGPVANLVTALVALPFALDATRPPLARTGAAAVVVIGAGIGLGNLIPFTSRGSASDGQRVLNVLTGRHSAQLADRRALHNLRNGQPAYAAQSTVPAANTASTDDGLDHLREAVDIGSPDVAIKAGLALARELIRGAKYPYDRVYAEIPRLATLVRRPGLDRHQVGLLTALIVWPVTCGELGALVKNRIHTDAQHLRALLALAQLGFAASPNNIINRNAVALPLAMLGHFEDVRRLYLELPPGGPADRQADAHAIRALAELNLGDVAQARRLLAAAETAGSSQPLVQLTRVVMTARAARTAEGA